jgi:proteic killer suppression protein
MLDVLRNAGYTGAMIRTFADKDTERLFRRERVARFQRIEDRARKRLDALESATSLNDLAAIPGTRLEKLPMRGKKRSVYSIRIDGQYRIEFRWDGGWAEEVRITDHYER